MHCPNRLKHLLLYIYHKHKNRHLVRFPYSAHMSHRCEFEGMNAIGTHSSFYGKMGKGSYMGSGCHLDAVIGRYTSIGHRASQIIVTHPYKAPFVTTSPMFFSKKKQNGYSFAKSQKINEYIFFDKESQIAVKIGSDCWIGYDVCFIGGVQIGDGAVVLSRAIVTKDVPPYAIVGGIPAKVIGYRYNEDTIKLLQEVQWWNQDVEWLKEHSDLLCDMENFKSYWHHHKL